MANQIVVVAILMIVQGVLECILGALLLVLSMNAREVMKMMGPMWGPAINPAEMEQIITIIYLAFGAINLVVGLIHIAAGITNARYRGRVFGIIALFLGIGTFASCYCAPTALGLMIYGLIVYFNQQSAKAFEMGAKGMSGAEIKAALQRGDSFGFDDQKRAYNDPDDWGYGPRQ